MWERKREKKKEKRKRRRKGLVQIINNKRAQKSHTFVIFVEQHKRENKKKRGRDTCSILVILFFFERGGSESSTTNRGTFSCLSLLVTSIPREFSSAPRAHKNSTTRNKMAFSMTSALSSRVSATTSSLRTQRVQKRQSASFKCNAYDEAEIDKRYPQGGSVYKVCFSFFSRSLSSSLSLCRLSRDIANDDNATFARRCCRCFFAKSSISLNFV